MGLSLRNITKKIGDVVGGAEHAVFGGGAPQRQPAPQRPAPVLNYQQPRPVLGLRTNTAPINFGGVNLDSPTKQFPTTPYHTPGIISNVVRPLLRTVPETISSLQPRQVTYHPGSGIEKALFGTTPVQNIQKKTVSTYKAHPGGGALPLAAAEAIGSVTQDLPVAKAFGTGAKIAFKTAKPGLKAVEADEVGAVGKNITKPKVGPKTAKQKVAAKQTATQIITKPSTDLRPTKISNADIILKSTTGVLNKIDPRLGAMVHQRRELGETSAALAKSKLKITNTLNKDEQTNLARVLKGTEAAVNDKVSAAADETRKVLTSTYYQAKNSGVPVPGFRKNYFPQIHNPKVFQEGTKQSDRAIAHLIDSGQANSEADAVGILRKFRDANTVSPYQNLSKTRALDLPGYAENIGAIHQYLERAHASIAHAKVFGAGDKNFNKVLNEVRKNQGDSVYNQAVKSYKQASGLVRGSDRAEKASRIATNLQGATKLGLSSIGNLSQQANTAIAGGVGRTAKSFLTQGTKANRAFLSETGVGDEQVAHEALFGEQGVSSKIRKVTAPGFERIEKSNRNTAGLVGRDLANKLAKKAAVGDVRAAQRLQRDFGITGVTKRGLTAAQQRQAARTMVERTQFRTGAQDLPGFATSPTGRVITQFKRYPYKQVQFLKKEVVDQTRRGNLAPVARLAAVGAPVGLATNYAQDKIRGTNFKQSAPEKVLDVANNVTGANLITSLAQGLYPSSYDANSYMAKIGKTLGGPTGSDAIKAVQAGFEASKGKPTNAGRLGLSHVPVVGTPLSNRLLPYANAPTAVNTDGTPKLSPTEQIATAFGGKEPLFSFNGKDLSASDFIKLSDADKRLAAAGDPNARKVYDEWQGAKTALGAPKLYAPSLDAQSTSTLKMFDRLTTQGKDAVYARQPDAEYRYAVAKYQNDKLNGGLTEVEDIRRQDELAKKFIGSKFDKTIRDSYGLAKKDMTRYITEHPDQANALMAYDQALYNAGLISSLKFDNGIGGSGGGSKSTFSNPQEYALSQKKGAGFSGGRSSVSVKKVAKAKIASRGAGKFKVSSKKSLV